MLPRPTRPAAATEKWPRSFAYHQSRCDTNCARRTQPLIVAHNHPCGQAEPSRADEYLTQSLKTALALVDVRLLDHFVVGCDAIVSFAERGMV
ncbi:JAB domain-containing protein [Sphaerotilus microaerophilus]|uniref:MPN domain-containing protein n=1 Tax=Sphaerotilus microaerophilus TaxID=2914710 RepID=A0ABN6PNY3_9BURK|nr:hypothetical protein CATMQ487_29870 [Sphaerotilus sp. FB-5]